MSSNQGFFARGLRTSSRLAVSLCALSLMFEAGVTQAQTPVAPEAGNGTVNNPYQITVLGNLVWLKNQAANGKTSGQYYQLMNDIDASATANWNDNGTSTDVLEGFEPIGSFNGTFDGNNKKISGLYMNRAFNPQQRYAGMFGYVEGTILNLALENVNMTANFTVNSKSIQDRPFVFLGALAGDCTTITNCSSTGSVSGFFIDDEQTFEFPSYAGGLAGSCGTMTNCHSDCVVSGTNRDSDGNLTYVGGLVGYCDTIKSCYATGNVSTENSGVWNNCVYVGGLTGTTHGTISSCYATGNVIVRSSFVYVGGLIGTNNGTISSCYATGNVTGQGSCSSSRISAGGLVGANNGPINSCSASGNVSGSGSNTSPFGFSFGVLVGINSGPIENSYAAGAVSGSQTGSSSSPSFGGLVGETHTTISMCYSVGRVTPDAAGNIGGLVGKCQGGTVDKCYWDMQTSTQASSSGGIGKTTAEMKQQATFAGWDFTDTWSIPANDYPQLTKLSQGALQVMTAPKGPATAGAKWSVDNSTWYDNGACIVLKAGLYSVYFTDVPGYITPSVMNVTVQPVVTTLSTGVYTPFTYTVSFDANGGSGTMASQSFQQDIAQSLRPNTFTRSGGYAFAGWNTAANGTGTSYVDRQKINVSGNMALFAQWNYIPYDIELLAGNFSAGTVTPLIPGASVDLSWDLKGNAATTTPFWCEVFASKTGGFDMVRFGSSMTNSYLAPGTNGSRQTFAPNDQKLKTLPNGVYSLVSMVNREAIKTISENGYVNNWLTIPGKRLRICDTQVPTADLEMTRMDVTVDPNDENRVTISGKVRNSGSTPLPSDGCWVEAFYGKLTQERTLNVIDSVGLGFNLNNLPPGAETTYNLSGVVPGGAKNFAIAGIADSTDIIPETNETNNSKMWYMPQAIPDPPKTAVDLTVMGVTVDQNLLAPKQVAPGTLFNCVVTVKNNGQSDPGYVWVELFGSQDGGVSFVRGSGLVDGMYVKAPACGETAAYWFSNVPLKAIGDGMYTVVAVIDRAGLPGNVGDRWPMDNRAVFSGGRVSLSTPPQQGTVNLVWSEGPTFTQTSGTMTVTGKVKNTGSAASKEFWTEAFTGDFDPAMGTFTRDWNFFADGIYCGGLAPGAEKAITISGKVEPFKILGVIVDGTDLIAETDETDNYDYSELTQ